MKKTILFILCTCFMIIATQAQRGGGREKIKTLKVAYITEKLQFSSDEAQKFWPIYNAYEEKTRKYRMEIGKIKRKLKEQQNIDNISEAEAKKMLAQMENAEENIFRERKQWIKDLQKVISAKKILLLKKAEDDFNRDLLEKFKQRRQQRLNNRN